MDENIVTWRPGVADDAPLLLRIFAANKAAEFASLGLSDQQLLPLLEMQFRTRQLSHVQNYGNALDMILCLADGTPVGRHLVDRKLDCYRTVDLAILPEHQNQGIGAWTLRLLQQLAEIEGVPCRLSVAYNNPARRLYERLGFRTVSSDEVSYEMEWRSEGLAANPRPPRSTMNVRSRVEAPVIPSAAGELQRAAVLDKIFSFLREIGLNVYLSPVPESFLPGIQLISGGLQVDLDTLLYPGDLLHEAGHLAVMPPDRRNSSQPASTTDGGEEMAAICWSYAAIVHLGLPPEVVFHEGGYRGTARDLIRGFAGGIRPGLPLLAWMGLTTPDSPQQPTIFPRMLCWLRETPANPYAELDQTPLLEEVHA